MARRGEPGSPGEGFPGYEEEAAAAGDFDAVVEVEAVGEAGVYGGGGGGRVGEDVHAAEVGLGRFGGRGAAVGGFGEGLWG